MTDGFDPQSRWSRRVVAKGYVCIPNLLIENIGALDLKAIDFAVLVAIDKFRWHGSKQPYPSNKTLSKMLGVSERSIKRSTAKLDKYGYLYKVRGWNNSNHYDFSPLIEILVYMSED